MSEQSSNNVIRVLYAQSAEFGYPGDAFDMICESYRNVSCLFKEAEKDVREEIGYYLEEYRETGKLDHHNEYGINLDNPFEGLFLKTAKDCQSKSCGRAIIAISDELKKKKRHADTVDLMVEINGIPGEYIFIEKNDTDKSFAKRFDISKIDFDLLRREFAKVNKQNLMLKDLDELIQVRLDSMLKENPNRVDYYERYQQIIEEYNSEQDRATIEKTFMDLANSMNTEEQRYVREGFSSDEELSLYDMLFTEDLSKDDIKAIKKVAVDLLDKIKPRIAQLDHWTDRQETKAEIDNLIRDTLWTELPECYDEIRISEYRQKIYEYVYMRYKEVA